MSRRPALTLALLLAAAPASGDERVQAADGEGRAPVQDDLHAARERAKDDALRGCVQAVASGVVTAPADADQAQLLAERILARAVGYVRRFQVVDDRQDGAAWATRVRCEVSAGKLEDDLLAADAVQRRDGLPRVLVLLAEQPLGAAGPAGWWQGGASDLRAAERALAARLAPAGFAFADAPAAALAALGAAPADAQAREAGARAGAEVVVVGRAVARPLGELRINGGAFHTAAATVAARALRVDTGEVLASVEVTAPPGRGFDPAAAGREALAEAGRQLGRELFARVGQAWAREQAGVRRIGLGVRGVEDYARLAAFKALLLGQVRGVREVQERALGDGRAELEVALAGTPQSLATDLATRRLGGFDVRVLQVTQGGVEVELDRAR